MRLFPAFNEAFASGAAGFGEAEETLRPAKSKPFFALNLDHVIQQVVVEIEIRFGKTLEGEWEALFSSRSW